MRAPAIAASPSPARAVEPSPAVRASLGPRTDAPAGPQTPSGQLGANLAATPTPSQLDRDSAAADTGGEQSDAGADDVEAPLDWQAYVPTDTADHLATMDKAARDSGCGVPWHLLAAIARVESDFGRNMGPSSAGALGYGQFLPSSWESFGNDGNTYDYRDALPAIATYLCQSGLERDPRAALFAYNHADWYVDLVLDLAVRYDRMAPGAPTPNVLDVGPAAEVGAPLHYAAGRDVRRQSRARSLDAETDWLGVPWHGRLPGAPISPLTMEATTLAMVGEAFGLTGEPPPADANASQLTDYANRALDLGLLAVPIQPPVQLPAPDTDRPAQEAQWSIAEIRASLDRGEPLVALVDAGRLPGHSPHEAIGDQPMVLIGKTPTGLVYSDPSFSSSLGYGLELSDADFLVAWQAASTPRQALAFTLRPPPLALETLETHLRMAELPPVSARVLPTEATPRPEPTPEATPARLAPPAAAAQAPDAPMPGAAEATAHAAATIAQTTAGAAESSDDPSWMIIVGSAAAIVAALAIRRLRARRSA